MRTVTPEEVESIAGGLTKRMPRKMRPMLRKPLGGSGGGTSVSGTFPGVGSGSGGFGTSGLNAAEWPTFAIATKTSVTYFWQDGQSQTFTGGNAANDNQNPINLMYFNNPPPGFLAESEGFDIFDNEKDGYNDSVQDVQDRYTLHGETTVTSLVYALAPLAQNPNDPTTINAIANYMNIGPEQLIPYSELNVFTEQFARQSEGYRGLMPKLARP